MRQRQPICGERRAVVPERWEMTMKRFGRKRCGEIAAQNITAQLADSLIGSLGDLTAIDSEELRRQVVMLIDHSYALGPLPF